MMIRGMINIEGMEFTVTVDIPDKITWRVVKYRNDKFRTYKNENGKQVHLGYYDNTIDAERAGRLGRKLVKNKPSNNGIYLTSKGDGRPPVYRVALTLRRGQTVKLGEYQTWGNAALVRDVVARRTGIAALVADYEMPLILLTNAVARSYVTDIVRPATPEEINTYLSRVASLNESVPNGNGT